MSRFAAVTAPGVRALGLLDRRLRGRFDIDEWGLDPELIDLLDPILGLRWDIHVDGVDGLPVTGGALLVHNRGFGLDERWVLARGIREAGGRFVRTPGLIDRAPLGPMARRLGAVADRDEELAGLLRAGQLVGVPLGADHLLSAGRVAAAVDRGSGLPIERLGLAHDAGVPIVPVAVVGHPLGRRWRIVVGTPVAPARSRERSEAAFEIAGRTVARMIADARSTARWP